MVRQLDLNVYLRKDRIRLHQVSIARSLTVLSLVHRFGQKRLLND